MNQKAEAVEHAPQDSSASLPVARCGVAGILMGLANLVPGISGGTMILIMGLYEEFIASVANLTRLKFSRRSLLLLGIIGAAAACAIVGLSGTLSSLVTTQPVIMYGLFIGMTLGGAPLLLKMATPWRGTTVVAMIAGIALMFAIQFAGGEVDRPSDEEKAARKAMIERGEYELKVNYSRDLVAGVLGMSAMVLPGISGAYMLLILGRYEQILSAISLGKSYILSFGKAGDINAFRIILPVGIGVVISLVLVTNILKWLLKTHEKPTIGCLLGIVIGSAVTLAISKAPTTAGDWAIGGGMLLAGFVATIAIERLSGVKPESSHEVAGPPASPDAGA
ncbi:MAG TPA: DUF368 domain-containing protein [Phycisphaerae bacterium]|nr:DUF368 domain-containing protein [Phycisphaerae bacterium]HRW52749.1 DUF368 domain-containing protein [Phycisphaerae bacterium]